MFVDEICPEKKSLENTGISCHNNYKKDPRSFS